MHLHLGAPQRELKAWFEPRIEPALNHGVSEREVTKILRIVETRHGIPNEGGVTTSNVEVVSIGKQGFWLSLENGELFLAFAEFPSLADAAARQS